MNGYSIGIGLTSACPYACPHCYSGGGRDPVHLDPERLLRFLDAFPVTAVNLGTGESSMHPRFLSVTEAILERGIPLALTTAGPSLQALPDSLLRGLNDVDLSLDYPSEALHDAVRAPGAFRGVLEGIRRCRELGVTVSLALCLMKENAPHLQGVCAFARERGLPLRVNVYKPVFGRRFEPSYLEFWDALRVFFRETRAVSCTEPVVNAALAYHGLAGNASGSPCGEHGFRISPRGEVLPCVYWGSTGLSLEKVLDHPSLLKECGSQCHGAPVPEACGPCPWKDVCLGGCPGRRYYTGFHEPDTFCFHLRGLPPPKLPMEGTDGGEFIHAGYLCTLIGLPRTP